MDNQFFTMEMLTSLAGITAGVVLVVQFTKTPVDKIVELIGKLFKKELKIPTAFWTVVVSEFMMFITKYFTIGKLDEATIFLTALNALVVSGAAMKSFDSLAKRG